MCWLHLVWKNKVIKTDAKDKINIYCYTLLIFTNLLVLAINLNTFLWRPCSTGKCKFLDDSSIWFATKSLIQLSAAQILLRESSVMIFVQITCPLHKVQAVIHRRTKVEDRNIQDTICVSGTLEYLLKCKFYIRSSLKEWNLPMMHPLNVR